jgi:hypothetical protein
VLIRLGCFSDEKNKKIKQKKKTTNFFQRRCPEVMAWRTQASTNADLISGLCQSGVVKSKPVENAMRQVDRGNFITKEGKANAPE